MTSSREVPCTMMRGGTSKGIFIVKENLPPELFQHQIGLLARRIYGRYILPPSRNLQRRLRLSPHRMGVEPRQVLEMGSYGRGTGVRRIYSGESL